MHISYLAVKKIFYRLLIILLLLASTIFFILGTTPGLKTSLALANYFVPGKLIITSVKGRLFNHITLKQITYVNNGLTLKINNLDVSWYLPDLLHYQLTIDSLRADEVNLTLAAFKQREKQTEALPTTLPNLPKYWLIRNASIAKLTIRQNDAIGQLTTIHMQAHLTNQQKHFNGSQLQLMGKWTELNWPINAQYRFISKTGQLNIHGTLPHMILTLNGQINEPLSAALQAHASTNVAGGQVKAALVSKAGNINLDLFYDANHRPKLTGNLKAHLTAVDEKLALPLKQLQAQAHFSGESIPTLSLYTQVKGLYNENPTQVVIRYNKQALSAVVDLGPNHMQINGSALFPWRLIASLPQPALLHSSLAGLKSTISAKATLVGKQQGDLTLSLSKGKFKNHAIPKITFEGATIQAKLDNKQLQTTGNLSLGEAQRLRLTFNLPHFNLFKPSNQTWQAKGEFFSHDNILFIHGQGELNPTIKGIVNLKGEQIPLMTSKEYTIYVSPNLAFEFTPSDLKMRGHILVPKAAIKPQIFSSSVSLTDDVVFADKKEAPNPFNIDTDIKIEMGNEAILAVKGLQGHLTGAVNLRQLPGGPLTASGELNIKEGQYKAYGQDLTIETGQLLFTGGLIDNPAIQLRAIRKLNNTSTITGSNRWFDFNSSNLQALDFGKKTTVGIKVSGRLNKPKVELFSAPATLSQADILSILLLGKPINQADKSGAQLLLAAVSALNLESGHGAPQLLSQLKQSLGIDFNFENDIKYDQKTNQSTDNTTLVISKSLSKRLYLSYNVGLSSKADSNVLTLKYLLNKFFSVQVNANTSGSGGIDLFYTHQKE